MSQVEQINLIRERLNPMMVRQFKESAVWQVIIECLKMENEDSINCLTDPAFRMEGCEREASFDFVRGQVIRTKEVLDFPDLMLNILDKEKEDA